MDARAKTIQEILHAGDQYLIPFFQRQYSWGKKNWSRLFKDIVELIIDEKDSRQHFLGPLVCTPGQNVPGEVPGYQLIDGQQRITTLTILLCALRQVAREHQLEDLADEITEDYLIHKRRKGLQRYKIVPRLGDREILTDIIDGSFPKDDSSKISVALSFFQEQIADLCYGEAETKLRQLFVAMTERLSLVVITIDDENQYEIFESLNSTGLPLEESDLIRNFLFMQVKTAEQEEFNADHWEEFERILDSVDGTSPIPPTAFYRNYLGDVPFVVKSASWSRL